MTKRLFITLTILLILQTLSSAQRHDNVWTFGYTCVPDDTTRFGGSNLYFDNNEIRGQYFCRDIRFAGNCTASISDAEGNLKLMFNGCTLNDANNEIVEGSTLLVNNDSNIEQTWWCIHGYNTPHGAMFLPDPYHDEKYYLFYRDIHEITEKPYGISDSFYVATVEWEDDMPYVSSKKAIISDTVSIVGSSAVRHANGKDWWIISKDRYHNIYHKILLNEEGAHLHSSQEIGNEEYAVNGGNTTRYSPDGKYFVILYPFGNLDIFTFDRGTGLFEEYLTLPFWGDAQANLVINTEFSPSGQFLYIAETDSLWQFDMSLGSDDFFDSRITVGLRDTFVDPFPTNFWLMQAAPDGKIYMSSRNGSQYLHVIHNPNEKGLACNFINNDYKLPTVNAFAMPYFPNFRLGPDTTWVNTLDVENIKITVFPNPATTYLNIKSDAYIDAVRIYDYNMNVVLYQDSGASQVDISAVPNGLYVIEFWKKNKVIDRQKLVVIK